MTTMDFSPVGVFIAIQGIILFLGVEISIRYALWYSYARRANLLLAPLMLFVSIFFFGLSLSDGNRISDRYILPAAIASYSHDVGIGVYIRQDISLSIVIVGMIGLLIPIWRIWDGHSWTRVSLEVSARIVLVTALYFYGLYFQHILSCFFSIACAA